MLPICILTSTSLLNYKGIQVFLIIEHFYTVKYLKLFALISHSMEVRVSLICQLIVAVWFCSTLFVWMQRCQKQQTFS